MESQREKNIDRVPTACQALAEKFPCVMNSFSSKVDPSGMAIPTELVRNAECPVLS